MKTSIPGRILLSLSLSVSVGCSQGVSFGNAIPEKIQQAVTPETPIICEPGQVVVVRPMKILFLVDQSGSNINGPFEHPGQATDPLKTFRYGVTDEFFQQHGSKQYLSWGFITFNGTSANGVINSGLPANPVFTSDPSVAAQSLITFKNSTDVGNTPYKAALNKARTLIQQDIASSLVQTDYRVVMITDGYPTDYCPGGAGVTYCPGAILESQIDADVLSIVNLAPTRIQINQVYYGFPDAGATARLQRMAMIGQGQYVDTNTSLEVHLDDLIEVEQPVCQ